jgi:hypothetical protein
MMKNENDGDRKVCYVVENGNRDKEGEREGG